MSGPIVVSYSLSAEVAAAGAAGAMALGALSLAAQALVEAEQMGREYREVLAETQARAAQQAEQRAALEQARLLSQAETVQRSARLQARLTRLEALAATLGGPPADYRRPADQAGAETWEAAIAELQGHLQETAGNLESRLVPAAAQAAHDDIGEMLHTYAVQRSLQPGLDAAQGAAFGDEVARILSRLELAGGEAVPAELDALARDILLAPSVERAATLGMELRLRVKQVIERRRKWQEEAGQLRAWLAELPEQAPAELRSALELAIAAGRPLDAAQRQALLALLESTRLAHRQREQEAAAQILEKSLRDLGYEVEEIAHTLFVEGGVSHFQREGWEDYYVRLRVDPREQTINFNVVRPRGMEDSTLRKRLDFLAEERWCAEFPKLQATLAARGIVFTVTRQLGAGELPVQAVDPAGLPKKHEADRQRHSPPVARTRPGLV